MSFQNLAGNVLGGGQELANAAFGAAKGALGVSPDIQQNNLEDLTFEHTTLKVHMSVDSNQFTAKIEIFVPDATGNFVVPAGHGSGKLPDGITVNVKGGDVIGQVDVWVDDQVRLKAKVAVSSHGKMHIEQAKIGAIISGKLERTDEIVWEY